MGTHRRWAGRVPPWGVLMLLLLGAISAPSFADGSGSARGPVSSPVQSHADGSGHRLVVTDLRRGSAAHVRRWPGRTITYAESIPAKWDWSLERALEAWNRAGGHLTFVRAKKGHRAQLVIGYGDTHGADGYASVGPAPRAFVHLNPGYKHAPTTAQLKVWVGRLFAHELGHVVGFQHTAGKCSLMVAVFDMGACPLLDKEPGYYACRWIDKPLLKRFVAAYGGKAKQPAQKCLIDPLPGQLGDAQFSGGTGGPVTLRWSAPSSAPRGSKVHLEVWAGTSCAGDPPRDLDVDLPLGSGSWSDPSDGTGGPHCYRAQVVNQYGAGPAPITAVVNRYQTPVGAPSVAPGPWDPSEGGWSFTASWPANTTLVGYASLAAPATCPAPGAAGTTQRSYTHGDALFVYAIKPEQCITFVARSGAGVSSTAVTLHLQAPRPPTPVVGTPVYDPDSDSWSVTVTPVGSFAPVAEVRTGACPATPPTDLTWPDSPDFFVAQPGPNCVHVALADPWLADWYGPVVSKGFTQPGA
jgi:hypothetical protein